MAAIEDGDAYSTMRYQGRQRFGENHPGTVASSSNIVPHSAHAGDPYYIGDIYQPSRIRRSYLENKHKTEGVYPSTAYMDHLDYLSDNGWPQLRYLADFMRVTTSPPKWKFLTSAAMGERACRVKAVLLVFHNDCIQTTEINTVEQLQKTLIQLPDPTSSEEYPPHLFVVEDLSRDVMELLVGRFLSRYLCCTARK